jgi:hypothetical protein
MPISPTSLDGVEFGSKAEKDVLLAARKSHLFKPESAWLYYSLKLNETGTAKITGECDFVYLDSTHIFFLEVKGGEVKFDSLNNRWLVMGGSKDKDPFKQAASLMFQVRDVLLPRLFNSRNISERLVFGYGTLFPESVKPKALLNHVNGTIEYHSDIIYDCYDQMASNGFSKYIEKLKTFWSERHRHKNYSLSGISSKEQATISDYFRVNLHFALPAGTLIENETKSLKHFTSYQSYILDNVELNKGSGGIVIGGPGTGKTLLAVELATQKAAKGRKVLLVCFNRFLAMHLNSVLSNSEIKVIHLHALYAELVPSSEWPQSFDEENYFDEVLPLYILNRISSSVLTEYDYLIIDEVQDLLNEYHFDVLNRMLAGGFKSGNWVMFMDLLSQNIYNNKKAADYLDYFRSVYPNFVNKLGANCRNTKNIMTFSHIVTGLPDMDCLRPDNYYKCHVQYGSNYVDITNQIGAEVNSIIKEANDLKKNITILCYSKEQMDIVSQSSLPVSGYGTGINQITISTIHGFKGLENSYIYIIGPDSYLPADEIQMSLLYIAITRATTKCLLYLLQENKESVLQKAEQSKIQ